MQVGKKCIVLLTVLTFFCARVSAAQRNVVHQNFIWYTYMNQFEFHKNWYLASEINNRTFFSPYAQHQLLIRFHVHRLLPKGFDVSAGIAYSLQDNQDPFKLNKLSVPELRPHFDIIQKQKFKYFTIDHRLRYEFRFYHNLTKSKNDLAEGYSFTNYRLRYQLQITIPLVKLREKQFLKLKVTDELFFNFGKNIIKNVFDQNRVFAGLNIDVLPSLTIELGYMNFYQKRASGIDYYNRNMARFAIYQRIQFHAKKTSKSL